MMLPRRWFIGSSKQAGREAALGLDKEANNSRALAFADILMDRSGGKFSPEGGARGRFEDLLRFRRLLSLMRLPVFLTLTLARSAFEGPEAAYEAAMRRIGDLLTERLGVKVWGRVVEVQAESGDGWVHWHIVADAAGTCFDLSAGRGRAWVDLGGLLGRLKEFWCERWGLGEPQGQELELVRSRGRMGSYLSKYVTKPWPAIPQWILSRSMMRVVGFSRAAGRLLRGESEVDEKSRIDEWDEWRRFCAEEYSVDVGPYRGEDEDERERLNVSDDVGRLDDESTQLEDEPEPVKRKRSTLLHRLARSGQSLKVVCKGAMVGVLSCSLNDLVAFVPHEYFGVEFGVRRFGACERFAVFLRGGTVGVVDRINRYLGEIGVLSMREDRVAEREVLYWEGWDRLQAG